MIRMKKAAIITFEFNYNYGAILQATALTKILEGRGYDTYIVNRGWSNLHTAGIGGVKHLNIKSLAARIIGNTYTLKNLHNFKAKHWQLTVPIKSELHLDNLLNEFDVIVCGSDQIWNSACISSQGLYYYGVNSNPNKQNVIAYAPSFGHDRFEASDTVINKIGEQLRNFKAISVREIDGLKILQEVFGIENAKQVLDPTMLLESRDYLKMANGKLCRKKKTLAYYILDYSDENMDFINRFAKSKGIIPINIGLPQKIHGRGLVNHLKSLKYPSVESWIRHIAEAEFVITDSYHGSVFSIIFNKQFLTFGNSHRGQSRFNSLFSTFDLTDWLIDIECNPTFNYKLINYADISSILQAERRKSFEFLDNALI